MGSQFGRWFSRNISNPVKHFTINVIDALVFTVFFAPYLYIVRPVVKVIANIGKGIYRYSLKGVFDSTIIPLYNSVTTPIKAVATSMGRWLHKSIIMPIFSLFGISSVSTPLALRKFLHFLVVIPTFILSSLLDVFLFFYVIMIHAVCLGAPLLIYLFWNYLPYRYDLLAYIPLFYIASYTMVLLGFWSKKVRLNGIYLWAWTSQIVSYSVFFVLVFIFGIFGMSQAMHANRNGDSALGKLGEMSFGVLLLLGIFWAVFSIILAILFPILGILIANFPNSIEETTYNVVVKFFRGQR
jgi:hypothetical protein